MKDLYFTSDLIKLLRHDKFYGTLKNLPVALRKLGLAQVERGDDVERMFYVLAVQIMDRGGESEPFLSEPFIYPEALVTLLKQAALPVPALLQPARTATSNAQQSLDESRFEQYFDTVCRNCGTVTDPLATSYRTPIARLVFRTYLETRLTLGIYTTAKYVLEHLSDFDSDGVVTALMDDGVTWRTGDGREKLTSVETIAKLILNFNRELKVLL